MLLKLFNIILFLSLILLLYLRLGKKITKTGPWLAVAIGIWLIVLIIYLPIFHLVQFARFKSFLSISGITASLVLVYYIGQLMRWAIDRSQLSEDIKHYFDRYLCIMFNYVIFGFYFFTFLLASILALQK